MKTNSLKSLIVTAFVAAFISTNVASAQSLVFSRVVLVSSSDAVPTGKVWKVVSALGTRTNISSNMVPGHVIVVNGTNINVASFAAGQSPSSGQSWEGTCNFPFWLPAGISLAVGTNVTYISVLEFTVVP